MELTDFKRHSSTVAQQMQAQLSDLLEKLTTAFGACDSISNCEITALVKDKSQADAEMMQE
eukprot:5428914-Amphidinium_carterae.1